MLRMLNAILERVQNYCFSSLNVQICDILFAVVVMVTLSFCYRFVKLSFPLLAAVALLKTCAHIPFLDDHKISNNSVSSTNFTSDIFVCFIFLPMFLFFSFFWYYSLPVLKKWSRNLIVTRRWSYF